MDTNITETDHQRGSKPAAEALGATTGSADEMVDGELIEEELLVEEVSIDGMCGVY